MENDMHKTNLENDGEKYAQMERCAQNGDMYTNGERCAQMANE
jgi:hypothetical protein